jgi:hypothetical protein
MKDKKFEKVYSAIANKPNFFIAHLPILVKPTA